MFLAVALFVARDGLDEWIAAKLAPHCRLALIAVVFNVGFLLRSTLMRTNRSRAVMSIRGRASDRRFWES
jgi:hypothetical protein